MLACVALLAAGSAVANAAPTGTVTLVQAHITTYCQAWQHYSGAHVYWNGALGNWVCTAYWPGGGFAYQIDPNAACFYWVASHSTGQGSWGINCLW
jgi:hypothetical protein